jgi:hypothetical protein
MHPEAGSNHPASSFVFRRTSKSGKPKRSCRPSGLLREGRRWVRAGNGKADLKVCSYVYVVRLFLVP